MASKNKYAIEGITNDMEFLYAGKIILDRKLKDIFALINLLLIDDKPENIHALRISFRRFRYVLEVFNSCISKKLFKTVNEKVKYLQDLIGECRDFDVLGIKVHEVAQEINTRIPKYFYERIDEKRLHSSRIIKLELIKFVSDKNINSILIK